MKTTRLLGTVCTVLFLAFSLLSHAKSASAEITIRSQVSIHPAYMGDLSLTYFTDNLGINDVHFLGGESIIFKIIVTNNNPELVTDVTVVDTIPDYLKPHYTELLGWNPTTRTVMYQIPFIDPGGTNETVVPMKIVDNQALPGAAQTFCLTNNVRFTASDSTGSDSSSFCVEKLPPKSTSTSATDSTVTPSITQAPQPAATPTPSAMPTNLTQIPNTGPQAGVLLIGGQILTLITGIVVKRRAT
jgi:hypothetical protein